MELRAMLLQPGLCRVERLCTGARTPLGCAVSLRRGSDTSHIRVAAPTTRLHVHHGRSFQPVRPQVQREGLRGAEAIPKPEQGPPALCLLLPTHCPLVTKNPVPARETGRPQAPAASSQQRCPARGRQSAGSWKHAHLRGPQGFWMQRLPSKQVPCTAPHPPVPAPMVPEGGRRGGIPGETPPLPQQPGAQPAAG